MSELIDEPACIRKDFDGPDHRHFKKIQHEHPMKPAKNAAYPGKRIISDAQQDSSQLFRMTQEHEQIKPKQQTRFALRSFPNHPKYRTILLRNPHHPAAETSGPNLTR
jgi:hypothetical protein